MTVSYAIGILTGLDPATGTRYHETAYIDIPNPTQTFTNNGFVDTGAVTASGFPVWVRNGNLGTVVQPTQEVLDAIERSLDRVVRGAKLSLSTPATLREWYLLHPDDLVYGSHV